MQISRQRHLIIISQLQEEYEEVSEDEEQYEDDGEDAPAPVVTPVSYTHLTLPTILLV